VSTNCNSEDLTMTITTAVRPELSTLTDERPDRAVQPAPPQTTRAGFIPRRLIDAAVAAVADETVDTEAIVGHGPVVLRVAV
jgi:hypothetical protein